MPNLDASSKVFSLCFLGIHYFSLTHFFFLWLKLSLENKNREDIRGDLGGWFYWA